MAKRTKAAAGLSKADVLDAFEREECSEHKTRLTFGGRRCQLAGMPQSYTDAALAELARAQGDAVRVSRPAVTTEGGIRAAVSYVATPARLANVLERYAAANAEPEPEGKPEAGGRPEVAAAPNGQG